MNELVEKVIKAIAENLPSQQDLDVPWTPDGYFVAKRAVRIDGWEKMARAAIDAMREPTDEMMRAMYDAMFIEKFDYTQAPMIGAGFEAAIDAALDPHPLHDNRAADGDHPGDNTAEDELD